MATKSPYERVTAQPENPFSSIVSNQQIAIVTEYTLESGYTLRKFPVAYKTWGQLNAEGTNAMVICHALTGSADVSDWWGPLIGAGRAFDTSRFFVVCMNSLGSPYGSASPCTINSETGQMYGPEFPLVTVRDDVNIHRLILDDLGVKQIAICIGGSMGGMLVMEYAFFGPQYVRAIIPLATSARHSAWCISWGEAQRQSIYSDPNYDDGYYSFDNPPSSGLSAARMTALLTYRSRNSFERKFGRNVPDPGRHRGVATPQREPSNPREANWAVHNDGFRRGKKLAPSPDSTPGSAPGSPTKLDKADKGGLYTVASSSSLNIARRPQTFFTAQNYLRYQGEKFVQRFDANCYIAITRKLDTHDVSRGRGDNLAESLATISQPALVIGIDSDGLFTFTEQEEMATYMPNARLERIHSQEGHDAFLLEFAEISRFMINFMREHLPEIMSADGVEVSEEVEAVTKSSLVGEAEVDNITNW
ncbi:Alpha/Beta hydrolase protein [Dipodascopsis tothii]|uniref:Alpha/Beta hydrolase protein n=1 Tax=Dipodascopsis tothii TaxID=44089 RepID=UPI0034CE44A6